jgi:replication factor A2
MLYIHIEYKGFNAFQQQQYGAAPTDSYAGGFSRQPDMGMGSPSGVAASPQRKTNDSSVRPVTIKQIEQAVHNGSNFTIDDKQVSQITLVALVLQVDAQSTYVTYTVDDGTGHVNAKLYVEHDAAALRASSIREGMYVRMYGSMNSFQKAKTLTMYRVTPIEDFNEVTFHYLDAIATHLYHTKGPLPSADGKVSAATNNAMFQQQQQLQTFSSAPIGQQSDEFSPAQKAVLSVFQADAENPVGTTLESVVKGLSSQFTPLQVQSAIEHLTGEGHLYTTVDEYHYKCTSA